MIYDFLPTLDFNFFNILEIKILTKHKFYLLHFSFVNREVTHSVIA